MDVLVKFGDSRSNRSRDIQDSQFVMDNEQTTVDVPCDNKTKCHKGQNALLLCLKTVKAGPNVSMWSQWEPLGGLLSVLSSTPDVPLSSKPGFERSHFHISANWLLVDKNVNRAHLRTHFQAVK